MKLRQVLLVLGSFVCSVFTLQAVTFTTVSNGNWNDPATWDANGSPGTYWGAADQVVVNHNVNLDVSFGYAGSLSIASNKSLIGNKNVALYNGASITANGEMDIAQFTLNATSNGVISKKLTVTQLTVGTGSTLSVSDSLIVNGKFTNNGGIVVAENYASISGNLENNNGSLTFNEKLDLGGNFDNNNASAVININDSMLVSGYVKNNSSGTINIAVDGFLGVTGNFTNNSGSSLNSSGRMDIGGNFQNNGGTVENDGVFILDGNFTQNGGSFTNDGVMIVNGNFRINSAGTVNGNGIIRTNSITNYGALSGENDVCGLDDATTTTQAGGGSYSGTTTYCEESASAALPIILVSFDVKWREGVLYAQWITASEINNDYFEVEYSANGKEFRPIMHRLGAGNSFSELSYVEGMNLSAVRANGYYRLKQTDFDGKFSYSEVKYLKLAHNDPSFHKGFQVYPNPLSGTSLYVSFDDLSVQGDIVYSLFNAKGVKVLEHRQTTSSFDSEDRSVEVLKGKQLSSGWYFLSIKTDSFSEQRKIIVP